MMEPIKVIAEILKREMGLKDGQIMLANQEYRIPNKGLYIALSYGATTPISNVSRSVPSPNGMREMQGVRVRHEIQIDILSQDNEARLRKEEVLMALRSVYSNEMQIKNSISIARNVGRLLDLSGIEGSRRQHRYVVTVPVFAVHLKETPVDHFDSFNAAVNPRANKPPEVSVHV